MLLLKLKGLKVTEHFFVKDGCNLVIDRQLNAKWKEIEPQDIVNFLNNKGLIWMNDILFKDTQFLAFKLSSLADGECRVLTICSEIEEGSFAISKGIEQEILNAFEFVK